MLSNYLKIALRNLFRHRFFSAINIFGLAVSMSIGMALIMLVADQMSHDRYNTKRDRIYRVTTVHVNEQGIPDKQPNAASCMPLRNELLEKYTGIEKAVRFKRGFANNWMEFEGQDVNIPVSGFFADPEVFDVFEYEFQYGDPATALTEPFTVVLTREATNKLFDEENPLGKPLKVGDHTYTITGILKKTDHKSHIRFEALASMVTVKSLEAQKQKINEFNGNEMDNWTNYWNGWTYIQLSPQTNTADVQQHLDKIYADHIAGITDPDVYKMKFDLQAVTDITPGGITNNSIGPVLPWIFVYFLGGLALVILITSCFNFTNLSIARSLTRAKEIGIRKVTGAARWQIFMQFLSESVIVSLFALVLASLFMFFLKPLVLQLNFARIFHWDLESGTFVYAVFLVFAIVVGILAGLFPAAVLSGFQPVKVLKSVGSMKLFSRMGLRKVLLVAQFTLSLFFILSVIVIQNQLDLFMSQQHGFNMENNIMIRLNKTAPGPLKTELMKYNNIKSVAAASHVPAAGINYGTSYRNAMEESDYIQMGFFLVDEDYVKNMNIDLVAGSFFEPGKEETSKQQVVINEAAIPMLHFESPSDAIGQQIIAEHDTVRKTIIGVVSNYNHRDLTRAISPMALFYNPDEFGVVQVAYIGNYEDASRTIEKAWASVNPGLKIDYSEVASEIHKFYEVVFGDLSSVVTVIAFLAIFISCLGLLGMATYTTETRIKEISIRKVLGSSANALILLLSKGFLKVIGISIVIGVPLTYFVNQLWLEQIAYHTSVSVLVILQGVIILIVFSGLTIGSQTIRATFVNPVDNLKNE